jgi:MFS family permease
MATASLPASPAPASVPVPHPLRDRNFRMLWAGSTISLMGDQFYLVALPWVVLQLTGSAIAVGTIMMSAAIPRAVLMLMGGAVTDRVSPRRILIYTASTRTALVGAIGALLWFNALHVWELYILGFAFGVADAFSMPAASTYLPLLVKREQLVQANSLFQTTSQLTTLTGPAPAGIVVKALGVAWAFLLDAVSFLFIIAALWRLPDPPKPQSAGRPPMLQAITEGITYVRRDAPLGTLLLVTAMLNLCLSGPLAVGLPYMIKIKFGSATAFGLVLSSVAAGGLAGAFLAGLWKVRRRGLLILSMCTLISLSLCTLGMMGRLWELMAMLTVIAMASGICNVHIIAWIQQRVEASVRGRVMSVVMLSGFGLLPVSLAAAGLLVAWNITWMFLLAGTAMLLVTGVGTLQKQVRGIE